MLPSTINTGSYVIEKYSRSNPSHVSAQTQSQGLTTGQPEWEHFAHPNMSLTLDVKKSMDNSYESVRLRIIWNNLNKGRDGTLGEAIMEDLDLLSFSNLDSQGHSAHGPPLKAVYRGPVVGIRYLSPPPVPATSPNVFTQSYCRFQVNFAYVSDATQFINAIRPVCPCKEIVGGPLPPPSIPVNKSLVPSAPQRPPLPASVTSMVERNPHYRSSQEELSQKASHFPPPSSSDLSLAPSSDPALPTHRFFDRSSQPSSSLPHEMHSSQSTAHDNKGGSSSTYYSLPPAPSQPTTPSADTTFARPSSQGPEEKEKMWEAFLDSLREDTELYSLTRQELENLVSVVVREKGFPKLLEALDSMWVARGFLGR